MKVATQCMICNADFANHQCSNCGSLVCDTDFDGSKGLCADCSSAPKKASKSRQ